MTLETLSENRSFGGTQGVYRHRSQSTGTDMTFAVFMPELVAQERVPVLWYLSGLTCTHDNAMTKAAAQQWCAEAGIAIVFPDTSPRGDDVADDVDRAVRTPVALGDQARLFGGGLGHGYQAQRAEQRLGRITLRVLTPAIASTRG